MSRSGYTDNQYDSWALIRWRGAVASAIRGKRGQAFLREMLAALDAIPDKTLIHGELVDGDSVCALGSVGMARKMDMSVLDPDERESVADAFHIPMALASEIMYENDEGTYKSETPEDRWKRMRKWVTGQLAEGNEA
jgi:hypothetical protein